MLFKSVALLILSCAAFSFSLNARQNNFYSDAALDELRLELSDVKHDLHSARIEINLLEEKIAKQEKGIASSKTQEQSKQKTSSVQTDSLEKKVAQLEKLLEKATADLRTLSTNAAQALAKIQDLELALSAQDKKFDEVVKLKGTLASISKAIAQPNKSSAVAATSMTKSYRIKAGDSLEKIARAQHTSVEMIKQLNPQLSNENKIIVGQELKLPADE